MLYIKNKEGRLFLTIPYTNLEHLQQNLDFLGSVIRLNWNVEEQWQYFKATDHKDSLKIIIQLRKKPHKKGLIHLAQKIEELVRFLSKSRKEVTPSKTSSTKQVEEYTLWENYIITKIKKSLEEL